MYKILFIWRNNKYKLLNEKEKHIINRAEKQLIKKKFVLS